MDGLDKFIEQQIQNAEFKKEWEASQHDFELAKARIVESINQNQQVTEINIGKVQIA